MINMITGSSKYFDLPVIDGDFMVGPGSRGHS